MKRAITLAGIILVFGAVLFTGCKTKNNPPDTPSVPTGESLGFINTFYYFASKARDFDNDRVAIRFAWGDGDTSTWSFYGAPDSTITVRHAWTDAGFYYVKAQGRDEHDDISIWSGGHQIMISNFNGWAKTFLPKINR